MKFLGMIIIGLMVLMTLGACKSGGHCDAYGNKAAIKR